MLTVEIGTIIANIFIYQKKYTDNYIYFCFKKNDETIWRYKLVHWIQNT